MSLFLTLVQTVCAGVDTLNQTQVWTKQPDGDKIFKVVSIHFQFGMNTDQP